MVWWYINSTDDDGVRFFRPVNAEWDSEREGLMLLILSMWETESRTEIKTEMCCDELK